MKSRLKVILFVLALIFVCPLYFLFLLFSCLTKGDGTFQSASQLLSLIPSRIGTYLRAAFYFCACTDVNREVSIGFATLLSHSDTSIGKHVYIGAQSNIGSCFIGDDCLLGSGVHILSGKHQHDISDTTVAIRLQQGQIQKIYIGNNCWIGNNATVMATVGANSIVAAGAVVVNEIPSNCIAAGNPAKIVRQR